MFTVDMEKWRPQSIEIITQPVGIKTKLFYCSGLGLFWTIFFI